MSWKHTNIFPYLSYDESRRSYADPLQVRRFLLRFTGGELDKLIDAQSSENVLEREDADEKLIAAIRQTFQLKPIEPSTGEGVTDAYCLGLLKQFVEFYEAKKAEAGTTPIS